MTDIEIELNAFLGTPEGAYAAAEIGADVVSRIFFAGAIAQRDIALQTLAELKDELIQERKEAA